MKEPDYDSYTLEQLLDVRKNIDRESYPERFHRIENILNDGEKLEKLKLAQEKLKEDIKSLTSPKKVAHFVCGRREDAAPVGEASTVYE